MRIEDLECGRHELARRDFREVSGCSGKLLVHAAASAERLVGRRMRQ
jgi:hypothetical protein